MLKIIFYHYVSKIALILAQFTLFGETSHYMYMYICDPASQNQQKVAWPSFVLWLEIGDQGQHG